MPLNFLEGPVVFHNTDERFRHNKRRGGGGVGGGEDLGAERKEMVRVKRSGADARLTWC